MKKIILFFSLLFLTQISFSQSIKIVDENGVDAESGVIMLSGDYMIHQTFSVINTGSTTLNVKFSFEIQGQHSPNFTYQFCDETSCKSLFDAQATTWADPDGPFTIAPGDTTIMKPQVLVKNSAPGVTNVHYFVNSATDSLGMINIQFTSTAAVKENQKPVFRFYPNPAQNEVTLQGESLKTGGTFVITDALGKVVKKQSIQGVVQTVSLANIRKGVYFVNFISKEGLKSETRRLIVQ